MFKDFQGLQHIYAEKLLALNAINRINIIDIREPFEVNICKIPDCLFIPMKTLLTHFESLLDQTQQYFIICHTGQRSYYVTDYLSKQGYNVVNVVGGISMIPEFNVPY